MALLSAHFQSHYINYKDEVLLAPVDDDMGDMRNVQFIAEDEGYAEYTTGEGRLLDKVQSKALFNRLTGIWEEAKAKALQVEADRIAEANAVVEKERQNREEALRKAAEPYFVPPTKAVVMSRMTDNELDDLDALISSRGALRMLWTHSDSFSEHKARVIDLMVNYGWNVQRVNELFADVQITPTDVVAASDGGQ